MTSQHQAPEHKPEQAKQPQVDSASFPELASETSVSVLPNDGIHIEGHSPVQRQVERLADLGFHPIQRQAMIRQIGQIQGNRRLQKAMSALALKRVSNSPRAFSSSQIQREDGEESESGEEVEPELTGAETDAARARFEEMLSGGERGWHLTLPSSRLRAGSIRYLRGGRRSSPRLGGRYPRRPTMTPLDDPVEEAARQMLIEDIRGRLGGITAPTESGQMPTFRGGYVYRARESAAGSAASASHQEYTNTATLESIGLDPNDRRTAAIWNQFHLIIVHEGDTSAINAWDNQILTIGAGFSQRYGLAGSIYNRMPPAFRQNLYEHGICVNEDNSFTVLDLDRGVVETGRNALRLIQVNPGMLSLLVQSAQSQTEMTQGESTMSARAWMLRSQFEQFLSQNSDIPGSALAWPENSLRFGFLLRHWQGALSWASMGATSGSPNALANYALRTLQRVHRGDADWTPAYIRGRISGLARDAGVGRVTFQQ